MVNKVELVYQPRKDRNFQYIHKNFSRKMDRLQVFRVVNIFYFYYQSNFSSFAHFKNVWWVVPSRAAAFRADISLLIQLW